jgi:hypothetical protein
MLYARVAIAELTRAHILSASIEGGPRLGACGRSDG